MVSMPKKREQLYSMLKSRIASYQYSYGSSLHLWVAGRGNQSNHSALRALRMSNNAVTSSGNMASDGYCLGLFFSALLHFWRRFGERDHNGYKEKGVHGSFSLICLLRGPRTSSNDGHL